MKLSKKHEGTKELERNVYDYPTATMTQAAVVFGWSRDRFRKSYNGGMYREIRHEDTSSGRKLLLTDVIRAAFPEASNHTIHVLAFDYLLRQRAERKEKWGSTAPTIQEKRASYLRGAKAGMAFGGTESAYGQLNIVPFFSSGELSQMLKLTGLKIDKDIKVDYVGDHADVAAFLAHHELTPESLEEAGVDLDQLYGIVTVLA